ncbi:MAG: hypothetical protein JWP13_945, partial [Candidatus Saccharibacteria bacterium]|nr:hypothetical protein [Candidatus Saccharibacteria bacterium]
MHLDTALSGVGAGLSPCSRCLLLGSNLTRKEYKIKIAFIKRTLSILLGAIIAAIGLEAFLIPNQLLDGGIVGISIIGAELSGLPLGIFLFLLNLPFIFLGYKKLGREFAVASMLGITA